MTILIMAARWAGSRRETVNWNALSVAQRSVFRENGRVRVSVRI
jgi:hypothetical protein